MELRVVIPWRAEDTAWEKEEDGLTKRIHVPCVLPRGTVLLVSVDRFAADAPVQIESYYWDERQPEILTAETNPISVKGKAADFAAMMAANGWH